MQIIFYGLERSGNHAIIHWILRNINPDIKVVMPTYVHASVTEPKVIFFNDVITSQGAIVPYLEKVENYQHLLASVEETYIDPYKTCIPWNKNEPVYKIFILRDPFNCYASRVKSSGRIETVQDFINKYTHLVNSLRYSSVDSNPILHIYYNKWWQNKEYRDYISNQIEIPNINDIRIKAREGGGSHFNTENYNNRTDEVEIYTSENREIRNFYIDQNLDNLFRI